MAYLVMPDIVMAYIVTAYIVTAYIVMAYIGMAYVVMAYIVMAGACRRPRPTRRPCTPTCGGARATRSTTGSGSPI